MIRLTKSSPSLEVTALLEKEKQKVSGTYRHECILKQIQIDFHHKCYLCEQKDLTSINIEHFIPHKEDKELKFDWNNLYYACSHCNNTKLALYDYILDPLRDDVESLLSYKYEAFHVTQDVLINALSKDLKVIQTADLLNKIYNGTTSIKRLEAINIKKQLRIELHLFRQDLEEYEDALDDRERSLALKHIKRHLHTNSAFTAFKRQYIKDIPILYETFGHLL